MVNIMGKKSRIIQYIIILILATAITILMYYIKSHSKYNVDITFSSDQTVIDNPLMGLTPKASSHRLCDNTKLVFIKLTWAEWEPEEGKFDIESLENKNNIPEWKESHKHAVLRFVCDDPDDKIHMDIPGWLYDKTSKGTFYDMKKRKGYSPDYSDPVFKAYHKKALEALAEYCNRDHFISFVQLGSIGHWGEWHATDGNGNNIMPGSDICAEYANLYSELFENARLLTRRNYDFSVDNGMGVFNDMVGHNEDTEEWLDWINNGDSQETSGQTLILKPCPDIGLRSPVGGEFTSSVPMEEILGEGIGEVLQNITTSRMTFIGPMVPDYTKEEFATPTESVLKRMGYRIYPSRFKMLYNFSSNALNMSVSFRNSGNAGFYFDWPVNLVIFDKDKNMIFWQGLDIDLRTLSKDTDVTTSISVPFSETISDEFYVGINITDYDGMDHIKLAISPAEEAEFIDGAQIIYHYPIDNDNSNG